MNIYYTDYLGPSIRCPKEKVLNEIIPHWFTVIYNVGTGDNNHERVDVVCLHSVLTVEDKTRKKGSILTQMGRGCQSMTEEVGEHESNMSSDQNPKTIFEEKEKFSYNWDLVEEGFGGWKILKKATSVRRKENMCWIS